MRYALLLGAGLIGLAAAASDSADGVSYRDLNRNGRLDPYEDARLSVEQRTNDLVARMTLEEKVGAMLRGTLAAPDTPAGNSKIGYDLVAAERLVGKAHITSFITRLIVPPSRFAEQNNAIQKFAEGTRLGI